MSVDDQGFYDSTQVGDFELHKDSGKNYNLLSTYLWQPLCFVNTLKIPICYKTLQKLICPKCLIQSPIIICYFFA